MHAHEFIRLAKQRISELQEALDALSQEAQKHRLRIGELQSLREKTLTELTEANLPALTLNAIQEVERRTGYGKFRSYDPRAYMEQERSRLNQRIAAIEADERFIRREALLDPVAGELVLPIQKIRDDLAILEEATQRYESLPEFISLIERGYGTDAYKMNIFQLQYYKDWKRADEAAETLGYETFSEARQSYLRLCDSRDAYHREADAADAKANDVRTLIAARQDAQHRLDNLARIILDECRSALREHLAYVDREQLFTWSQGDRVREALVKKLHGLEKQAEYCEQLTTKQFDSERSVVEDSIAKIQKKIAKFSRPKYANARLGAQETQAWLIDPREKLFMKRERFWRDYDRLAYFDRYDSFDYARDMLWWDLISDGRIDGNFIPEVQTYYMQHPEYDPQMNDFGRAGEGSIFAADLGRDSSLEVS